MATGQKKWPPTKVEKVSSQKKWPVAKNFSKWPKILSPVLGATKGAIQHCCRLKSASPMRIPFVVIIRTSWLAFPRSLPLVPASRSLAPVPSLEHPRTGFLTTWSSSLDRAPSVDGLPFGVPSPLTMDAGLAPVFYTLERSHSGVHPH